MRYPQPDHEEAFEEFSLRLLRRHWNLPHLERFGHRGEGQSGIDLVDLSGADPLRGAQCKHHASHKTLSPQEVREEVIKARAFRPALRVYAILTTAKRSVAAQRTVMALNRQHRKKGWFSIELLTWDAIERLVDQYPEIRDLFETLSAPAWKEQLRGFHGRLDRIQELFTPSSSDAHDADIDEAKQHITKHDYQLARLLLNRLRTRAWDRLTARQRYRIVVNTGAALIGEGDLTAGGRLLIEGATYQPDDPSAMAFGAFGHELLDNRSEAYRLAGVALAQASTSAKAAAVRVRTAPDEVTFGELQRTLPPEAIDAEAAVALALRALKEQLFSSAEDFATKATRDMADWPVGWFTLGHVYLSRETEKLRRPHPNVPADPAHLQRAEGFFTASIDRARTYKPGHPIQVDALLSRSRARTLLTLRAGATSDIQEAYRLDPSNPYVLEAYATHLSDEGKFDEAIALLRHATSLADQPRHRFLLGIYLSKTGRAPDRKEAADIFSILAQDADFPFKIDAAAYALRAATDATDWDLAAALIERTSKYLTPIVIITLRGLLAHAQDDEALAREFARSARDLISNGTEVNEIRHVANLLSTVGLHGDALPLWQRLFVPSIDTSDASNLMASAGRIGRHDVIMDVCRSLRESGFASRDVLENEITLRERYDPPNAVGLIQEYLKTLPGDRMMRLRLSLLGRRLGRHELVSISEDDIPAVNAISPEAVPFVVRLLQDGNAADRALTYAYRALRRHFDRPETHEAFAAVMGPFRPQRPSIPEPTEVGPGTAVCFVEEGDPSNQWFVIEDDIDCYSSLGEIRSDAPLARALVGRKTGARVVIASSPVQDRVATIREIVDKHVYRYRDVLDKSQLRFSSAAVQAFRSEDANEQILKIKALADERYRHAASIIDLFRAHPISVHSVARALGRSETATQCDLATQHDICLRIGDRPADDIAVAFSNLNAGAQLVIDPTAVGTLSLLKAEHLLDALDSSILMPIAVSDDLVQGIAEVSDTAASISVIPEGHSLHTPDHDEKKNRAAHAQRLEAVRAHSTIVGCPSIAGLDPDLRNETEQIAGRAGTEAIVTSSAEQRVLWTDDAITATVAKARFGVRSLSTELVGRYLAESGLISRRDYWGLCAKLVACQYVPTPVSSDILIEAARLAQWNADHFPAAGVLDLIENDAFDSDAVVVIASSAVGGLFVALDLTITLEAFMIRMLDRIGHRSDGDNCVQRIMQQLPFVFGLNVLGLTQAKGIVSGWLRHRLRPVQI